MALVPEGLDTEHYVAAIVLLALIVLIALARGFRGVNVGGISVGVN